MFDKLILGGNIYTLDEQNNIYKALAIKKGKVVKLYEKEPLNYFSLAKKIIDLEGNIVIPAFTDAHFHFMSTAALRKIGFFISEIKNGRLEPSDIKGVEEKIRKFARKVPYSKPIICYNYIIPSIKEDRLPTRSELDEWCPGRRVIVLSMDGHSSSYSTKALRSMGISPEGHNGILRGEEHEFNMDKLNKIVKASISINLLIKGVEEVLNDAITHGIVGFHCLDGFSENKKDEALFFLTNFGGTFPLYIRLYPQVRNLEYVQKISKKMIYKRVGGCGNWEMDGSVGSQTAAFFESYKTEPNNFGKCYFEQNEINELVKKYNDLGYQICSHAIGTRAIERILKAYEYVLLKNNNNINPLRHRIEHFEFPTIDQVERAISKLKLIVSAQPGYAWMDENFQKAYRKYLKEEQFQRQIPLKTITKLGGIILGSSDSPVQHLNPFIQIHGMINFPISNESLNIYQALRTYTFNAAYATFEEKIRGTLEIGRNADFIILNQNPFKLNKKRIIELKVIKTYLKGKLLKKIKLNIPRILIKYLFSRKNKI